MNLKTQRNILAVAVIILLIVLGVLAGTGALSGAAGAGGGVKFDTATGQWIITSNEGQTVNPLNPGQSVVGLDAFIPGLNISDSDGNDVKFIADLNRDAPAFGANPTVAGVLKENVVNACSLPGGGIADVGSAEGSYAWNSKKHHYFFTFGEGKTVNKFTIGMVDWGDFLQWQAVEAPNESGVHTVNMYAYNAAGEVVDTYTYTFNTEANPGGGVNPPKYLRPSAQFPNYTPRSTFGTEAFGYGMKKAGDACEAEIGQPGKLIMTVEGTGITRVEIKFADNRSMDPHIALWLGALDIEFECLDCEEEGLNCTTTQGYWQNHADNTKKQFDPIWNALPNGASTEFFSTGMTWLEMLEEEDGGDAYIKLAHQYIAAYLNVERGADDANIDLAHAEELLSAHSIGSVPDDVRQDFVDTASSLDAFNNGQNGSPHCDNVTEEE